VTATASRRGDPLAIVRAALLAGAASDAEHVLAAADRDVAARLADAAAEVAGERAAARAGAERDAEAIVARSRSRARRRARAIVLAAQQAAAEQLRAQARSAARELRTDPAYPALLARLTATARDRLGPRAVAREHPDGGVLAEADGRRVAFTLDAAADRAVEALGRRVEELW
jgi:vacuolar-type H+-ATPase subunit E/Vma4